MDIILLINTSKDIKGRTNTFITPFILKRWDKEDIGILEKSKKQNMLMLAVKWAFIDRISIPRGLCHCGCFCLKLEAE